MVEHTFSGPDSGASFEAGHGFTSANDRGTPLSSFDSERPFGHASEHEGPGDSDFGDAPADAGSPSASGSGADVAASDDGEPRRRRRRRGRRGRGRRDEQAQPQDAEAGVAGAESSDDSGPVEPPLAEDDLPAPTDSPRASPESAGEPHEGGRRRRRGRRGRGRRDEPRAEGAPFERNESSGAPGEPDADADATGDEMTPSIGDAERVLDAPREPARDGTGETRDGGRRRRRGRGRGRDRAPAERDVRRAVVAPERVAEDRGSEAAEGAAAAGFDSGRASDEDGERRRRRRGRRGGRRKRGEPAGPVGVEIIPGDDDDLQVAVVAPNADELPELPDEAHLLSPAEPKRGRRERPRREERRDEEEEPERATSPRGKNLILVNASDPEEVRVAVVEGHQLADFQMTARRHKSYVNDIYRGKVVNLEPAIGAAFIDFGEGRNGFLHTSDVLSVYGDPDWSLEKLLTTKVDPDEWEEGSGQPHIDADVAEGEDHPAGHAGDHAHDAHEDHEEHRGHADDDHDAEAEAEVETPAPVRAPTPAREARRGGGHKRMRARPRLPISDLLKKGDTVVVQVTKDAIGDKGPTLTTYISIPGRYLVLMPSMSRTGVSRKIEDERERRRLKRILAQLDIPPGMGVIVRTAGTNATKADLKRDLDYLMLLWDSFGKRLVLGRGPAPLYEESDVAIRTIRDLFTPATEAVIVDDAKVFERVREFTEKLMPENIDRIKLHEGTKPLFHAHNVEQEFERLFARRIDLPSGGSIVFDQAEALVAIDVNSGKTRSDGFDFEDIALKTNLDAVPEIARQIRLRDLGGIIVIDFIDMQRAGSRRQVERAFRDAIEDDRARSKLGRISQFGLLELTRQRLGPGLVKMIFANCPRCRGSGRLRTSESRAQAILRRLGAALALKGFTKVEVRTQPEVVEHLKRYCHDTLKLLETQHAREIALSSVPDQVEDSVLRYLRADGREVRPGGRRKR